MIGAGPVAQAIHLPTIARLDGRVEVVAVLDPNLELAREVARPLGALACQSMEKLLSAAKIDIAVIGSPNAFHAQQTMALCAAGVRGILVEKPLGVSRDEAEQVRKAVASSGASLVVGAMHTYDEGWLRALEALRSWGDLAGHGPFHARLVCHIPANEYFEDMASQIVRPASGGAGPTPTPGELVSGGVLGLAIHNLPHLRHFIPAITDVAHAVPAKPWGYAITAVGVGGTLELLARTGGTWRPDWTLSVFGHDLSFEMNFPPSYVHTGSATTTVVLPDGSTSVFGGGLENGYLAEWRELLGIMDGAEPRYSVETLVEDLDYALGLAELASAAADRAVL
ncbi:MAG: Gfo/Idh/MocA family oxidoreductase [Propionibacteriaceae bacterium]|jgi:predicted dehydrogenase|nr:Gfo/Idh/MocA family oxidoreductase [Propionibacteriaceae bacterium]